MPAPHKRLSQFRRAFLSTFTLDILARGVSALTTILLLRALPTDSFAFIVFFLTVGQFFGSAATGGLRMRYARLEAERVSRGIEEPSAFHVTLRNGAVLIVAAAVVSLIGASALGVGKDAQERELFVVLGTAFTLGHASVELTSFHYQAQLAFLRAGLIQVARSVVIFVVAIATTIGLIDSGTVVALYFAIAVDIVALIVAVPIALATRHTTVVGEGRFGFGRESASLTLYSLVSSGWAYLDIFLVASLLSSTAVASYGAGLRYVAIITGPVPSLVAVLRIRTAQHDMIDSQEDQVGLMFRWLKQSFLPTFLILGAGAVAAIWLIPWLNNNRYPESVAIFQILLIATFAEFVTLPSSSLLVAQERYTTLAWVNTAVVALNIPLAVLTASLFGVVGVAFAGTTVGVLQVSLVTFLAAHPPKPGTHRPMRRHGQLAG